jgi:hypothetical protein
MENKQCQKCKQHFTFTEFHKDRTNNDGFKSFGVLLVKEYLVLKIVKYLSLFKT